MIGQTAVTLPATGAPLMTLSNHRGRSFDGDADLVEKLGRSVSLHVDGIPDLRESRSDVVVEGRISAEVVFIANLDREVPEVDTPLRRLGHPSDGEARPEGGQKELHRVDGSIGATECAARRSRSRRIARSSAPGPRPPSD